MKCKFKLQKIGFLQALGVMLYTMLIGILFKTLESYNIEPEGFIGISAMLFLLVISAAITVSLVFGYSAYLCANKKVKDGLKLFGYTMVWAIIFLAIIFATIIF